MKAALLTGIGKFEIRQVKDPKITADTDVLIRIKAAGVCGSDVHYFTQGRIGTQIVQFPAIIGHETAGIVERVGKTVTKVKPGQRIAVDPSWHCGTCDQCMAGRENTCRHVVFLGCPKELDGCFGEYIVLHEKCCYPIGDGMSFERAALAEPLSIAMYSVARSGIATGAGASAGILGVGPIGMSVFHTLRMKRVGAVYVTDKVEERLRLAEKLGPKWSGSPDNTDVVEEISRREPLLLDVVYECSGDTAAVPQAIRLLKPGGTLVLVAIHEVDSVPFPVHELRRKEITILNIRRQAHFTRKALDALESREADMDSLITHRFPLERIQEAFELVSRYRDGVMKAMITVD